MPRSPRDIGSSSLLDAMTASIDARAGTTVTSAEYMGKDADGKPVYRVRLKSRAGMSTVTLTWDGSTLERPRFTAKATGGIQEPNPQVQADAGTKLSAFQDKWAQWVANMLDNQSISGQTAAGFMKTIREWGGDPQALDDQFRFIQKNIPVGGKVVTQEFVPDDAGFGFGGFGGGGGGGFAGPQYVAPDRRVVTDFVKGTMVSLVGTVMDDDVERLVDLYMKDHRRDFDTLDKEIDPAQSVVEALRQTAAYKKIHALRPESEDERTWVADRKRAAAQGGLNTDKQEEFAITQATVGGDLPDVAQAASVAQFQESGSARNTLLDTKLREAAQNLFAGVVR